MLPEKSLKGLLRLLKIRPREVLTRQQVTALVIHDRQWVAPGPVSGLELPLEISGPDVIGMVNG